MPASFPDLKFPPLQRATLSNGTKVVLAERHDIPVVQMSYEFRGGYAADPAGKPGTASFTMGMLDEGAGDLDALAFADRAESLGANLGASASARQQQRLPVGAEGEPGPVAGAVRRHAAQAALRRRPTSSACAAQWIAGIKQEKAQPERHRLRVLPPLLYGAGHPYAIPFTGSGTEASIAGADPRRPGRAGTPARCVRRTPPWSWSATPRWREIVPLLEKHFGDWKAAGTGRRRRGDPAGGARRSSARVFLVDQPGAVQANIVAGQLVPSDAAIRTTVQFDIANTCSAATSPRA